MNEYNFDRTPITLLQKALDTLQAGFTTLPAIELPPDSEISKMVEVITEAAVLMQDNYPYFHPLYAGQMLKPPHPLAQAAYMMAMWINPNNHALDGGKASSAMEKEAVAHIARMFGWQKHLGHLTSGGTMANLEALWVAGKKQPGKKIAASTQAHYTHSRIGGVLGLECRLIPIDRHGKMDIQALEYELQKGDIGTVVATLGTTAIGAVDPLDEITALKEKYNIRVHADCAYGGYFTLVDNLKQETRRAFDALAKVDSLVIDPHKHGLQPYGCGCVLFRDPSVGSLYQHDSPYTYFSSDELHLGEISLECSRAGAAAVGLWATHRLLPLVAGGQFANGLKAGRRAARDFYAALQKDNRFITAFEPELDIVFFVLRAENTAHISILSRHLFDEAAKQNLHLALAELPASLFDFEIAGIRVEQETVTCVRLVFMKPGHADWLQRILDTLYGAVATITAPER